MEKLLATGHQVIVLPVKKDKEDGIQLVKSENSQVELCEVVSIGNKVENIKVEVGDHVYITTAAAVALFVEGEEYLCLHEDSVLCKLEKIKKEI